MKKDNWRIRRTAICLTLIWSAGLITVMVFFPTVTSLQERIADGLILLFISTLSSYVFGAVWDDRNVMKLRRRDRDDGSQDGGAGPSQ